MNILVLQETDWLTRGPHTQHHIFERLSKNKNIKVTVLDYDIDKTTRNSSLILKTKEYLNISKVVDNSRVKIIRTSHLQLAHFSRISSLITNFFKMIQIIKTSRPDIIIAFSITNGFIGLILSKIFHIPYAFFYIDILHELVPQKYLRKIARYTTRLNLKFSNEVFVHTKSQKEFIIKEGINPKKIKVIPDGVDLKNTMIDPSKIQKLKERYVISEKHFVIFFMGFLYHFAGLEEIIKYYNEKVSKGEFNLKLIILGDGGIYDHLKECVEKLKADWVILAGRVPFSEITEYIALSNLCLLSFEINHITKEILPIKILEYMAMKKPVLSTALPGVVKELGNKSGIIFTKNQLELIKKIEDLHNRKDELEKKGEKGYQLVKEHYNWDNIVNDFKIYILKIIKDYYNHFK